MAMNVRFTEDETEALRAQAEAEDRSMQDVARAAVREYVERHAHRERVAEALAILGPRNKDLLRRLGEA
jgi:predicted transcriptional regulator